MSEYTLYCFAQSGNAYKVALMLELSKADWRPRFVDFFKGETRTPEYRSINVMGEVPVLEHRGLRLSQSGVILDYLVGVLGTFGWRNEEERREVWRWVLFDNHKLTSYTATYRFMKAFTDQGDSPAAQNFGTRMRNAFAVLEAQLVNRPWVAADRPTIADLSLCSYLYFNDEFGVSWSEYPNIDAWLKRLAALPGWKHPYQLMPGHPRPT